MRIYICPECKKELRIINPDEYACSWVEENGRLKVSFMHYECSRNLKYKDITAEVMSDRIENI
jgi:hypothetical protein